jgi:hypothetical protein
VTTATTTSVTTAAPEAVEVADTGRVVETDVIRVDLVEDDEEETRLVLLLQLEVAPGCSGDT